MACIKTKLQISRIIITLALIGILIPASSALFDNYMSAAPPCCPVYEDYPDYPYPIDPYYQFPIFCACPFLDDALERWEQWDIPDYYWEYLIDTGSGNSSCTSCGGTSSSISYSNTALIIPEKDIVMAEYDQISISTSIISKEQALAKYRK